METWTLSVDRREASRQQMIDALRSLEESITDLQVELVDEHDYWEAADRGAFRDFVAFAAISHPQRAGLEYVAEDLLEQFGWLVDFRPPEQADGDLTDGH